MEFQFNEKGEREFARLEDIADHLGITRMTLYRWRMHDQNFIALMNDMGDKYMSSRTNDVYNALVSGAIDGNTKSIELFLKNRGLMTDRVEVTDNTSDADLKERANELERRMAAMLDNSDDDDSDGGE